VESAVQTIFRVQSPGYTDFYREAFSKILFCYIYVILTSRLRLWYGRLYGDRPQRRCINSSTSVKGVCYLLTRSLAVSHYRTSRYAIQFVAIEGMTYSALVSSEARSESWSPVFFAWNLLSVCLEFVVQTVI
jgi:hypothetical protein